MSKEKKGGRRAAKPLNYESQRLAFGDKLFFNPVITLSSLLDLELETTDIGIWVRFANDII